MNPIVARLKVTKNEGITNYSRTKNWFLLCLGQIEMQLNLSKDILICLLVRWWCDKHTFYSRKPKIMNLFNCQRPSKRTSLTSPSHPPQEFSAKATPNRRPKCHWCQWRVPNHPIDLCKSLDSPQGGSTDEPWLSFHPTPPQVLPQTVGENNGVSPTMLPYK